MSNIAIGTGIWLAAFAASSATLPEVQERLAAHAVIRGDFVQIRRLAMFKSPLESSGRFTLAREHGMIWRQVRPFDLLLVLTGERFSQQFGTAEPRVVKSSENPVMFHFTRLMLSLFEGDASAMEAQFDVAFADDDDAWRIDLVPREAPLKNVFRDIVIRGAAYIDGITLTEIRGDVTEIAFSGQYSEPASLTQDEQDVFAR